MDQHTSEWMFYEVLWRARARGVPYPLPWWVQMYFRHWTDAFDDGLFATREASFASNALYRYWNMVGVKDAEEECLVGQAGDVEPVYDEYGLTFFLFDPKTRSLHFPQNAKMQSPGTPPLTQELEDGYLPVILTRYRSPMAVAVEEKVFATTVGITQKSVALARFAVTNESSADQNLWFCLGVSPAGPTGFHRHDKARNCADRRLSLLRYIAGESRVEVNAQYGPLFDSEPAHFGTYGNGGSYDPDHYIDHGPYADLHLRSTLNGQDTAVDFIAGLCTGVFAWELALPGGGSWKLDVRLPVDDYRGTGDLTELRNASADVLESSNRSFWESKLDQSGIQVGMPAALARHWDVFRNSRANLLILADNGKIHPGPTIYDSFWFRDSSVEGIAAALVGDGNLAERQFMYEYPAKFNRSPTDWIGPCRAYGFFGGEHEKRDLEWDSNGQALWAIGRLDRILGPSRGVGAGMFWPYVVEGARWIRDNRDCNGLLMSGWSAEHLGDRGHPHYWDDFWAIAGLYEAVQLSARIGAGETSQLRGIYDDVVQATAASIRWVLGEQRRRGEWETYIPTGPADVCGKKTTMVGTLAYFHPCRLYLGSKLGADIDLAARMTLETIWHHWASEGGFRHWDAWNSYGPYLTLQLAHAFLLLGDTARMARCLDWTLNNAGFARVTRNDPPDAWQVVLGVWNEQHSFAVASDFAEFPPGCWYQGDIPHGWACAEFMMLIRDMLFFEAGEDDVPHIYLTPGLLPQWLDDGQPVRVSGAATVFGEPLEFSVTPRLSARRVEIDISQAPPGVRMVYPCRLGQARSATADGTPLPVSGADVWLPAGARHAAVLYQ